MAEVAEKIENISRELSDPATYSSTSDVADLGRQYEKAEAQSKQLEARWEQTAEGIEE